MASCRVTADVCVVLWVDEFNLYVRKCGDSKLRDLVVCLARLMRVVIPGVRVLGLFVGTDVRAALELCVRPWHARVNFL